MSEAQVAVTDGWTDRTLRVAQERRAKARSAPRSLGAALRDAGLTEAAPDPRDTDADDADDLTPDDETTPGTAHASSAASAFLASRSPRLAFFTEQDASRIVSAAPTQGVVSPPPWLRAARRGRWRTRMTNTFGWVMTLVIAGSIIGLAGRYLAVPPLGGETTTLQAHQ